MKIDRLNNYIERVAAKATEVRNDENMSKDILVFAGAMEIKGYEAGLRDALRIINGKDPSLLGSDILYGWVNKDEEEK